MSLPDQPHADRQARIDAEIDACTECNRRGFSKRPDCDGCTAAVDEAIAVASRSKEAV